MKNEQVNKDDELIEGKTLSGEVGLSVYLPAEDLGSVLTKTGAILGKQALVFSEGTTQDDCKKVIKAIHDFKNSVDGSYRWAVGDAIVFYSDKWGTYQKILDEVNITFEDAQNCASVSRKCPAEIRVAGLSWSHHREVCPLATVELRLEALLKALDLKMTVAALRIFVQSTSEKVNKTVKPPEPKYTEPVQTQKMTVTSWAAVWDFINQCSDESQIEKIITTLLPKCKDIAFLTETMEKCEVVAQELAKSLGYINEIPGDEDVA